MPVKDERPMLTVGDATFALAPLTLGSARRGGLLNDLKAVAGMRNSDFPDSTQFESMISIVGTSIRLADPIATADVFDAALDRLPFIDAVKIVADGFKRVMTLSKFDASTGTAAGETASPSS